MAATSRFAGILARIVSSAYGDVGTMGSAAYIFVSAPARGRQNGFALAFPVAIYEGIEHDAMQPRFQIGARDKTVEAGAGASNGILYEIFGILAVLGQLQGDAQ